MADLIDRQAVIDALERYKNDDPMYDLDENVQGWNEGLDTAIEVLKELPSAQRWILCSERLPEEGMNCLVCDKGSVAIDTFIGHGNPYNWKWYLRDYEAWMPLPEPWIGE